MINKLKYTIVLFILSITVHGQVGIGTNTPDASAVLDIQSSSNDKGILIPRMTQAQRNAIGSPATGLMIFQTDGNAGFYYYDGSSWEGFGEVKTVNGNSPAANGNVTLTFLATQTGTQAQRAATASPTDGLVHIVTGDAPAENDKVYIYSTGISTWTLSSGFTDTDEQDISGSSFTVATSALLIDIEDGSGQTLDLSALEELVNNADPATNLGGASQGDLAYDTTDDELQVFDGTSWVALISSVVTPTLDQVTGVGSTTTNGINIGSLTVNSEFTLPTATGTAGQYLTVSTTTSELVFASPAAVVTPTLDQVTDVGSTTTNSIEVGGATVTGDLTVNTNTTLDGNTTIGDTTSDDLTVTARLDSDLIPKTNNSRDLGSSSLNFDTVNTLNVTSNAAMTVSSTGILTLNTSATGTPTISLQQGGTEMAGIGSSTFFIGDSSSGNHYFFPSQGSTIGSTATGTPTVLAFTSTNTLEVFSINNLEQDDLASVLARGNTANNTINITTLVASNTIESKGTATLANGSTDDDVSLGNDDGDDLIINALLQSNLGFDSNNLYDIGTLTSNARNVYSRSLIANNDLSVNVSSTTDDQILFQQSGTTLAGVNSSTFYIGRGSNRYEFPQIAPATVNNQVLAYTATNSLTFTTLATLPTGTATGTTLRYNPSSSAWEETELIRYDPTNGGTTTISVSGTLTPNATNTFSIGTTSNEFSNVFTQKIETTESDIEFSMNNEAIYLKLDASKNLTFSNSTTTFIGSANLAFGNATLRSSNSQLNTALGNNALTDLSLSGEKNTAVGYNSMFNTEGGNENTALGHNALSNNVSGDNNLVLGTNAGATITTQSNNIVIGSSANVGSSSVENAIVIGYNARAPQSNYIQLGTTSSTLLNTSAVVSATGFETTGTATITTLTVGDTSKYTLPTTRGTPGQVLTVSTTTSQLVFADSSGTPNYFLANSEAVSKWSVNDELAFASPSISNGISFAGSSSDTISLPSGKVYKATAYIIVNPGTGFTGEQEFSFVFHDGSNSVGATGTYYQFSSSPDFFTTVPAVAIIDATSGSVNLTLKASSITNGAEAGVFSTSYVVVEEL